MKFNRIVCHLCIFNLQGGDILLETISSNVTEDVITLEFQCSDGTLVTQLIDFKNVIHHFKIFYLYIMQTEIKYFICSLRKYR